MAKRVHIPVFDRVTQVTAMADRAPKSKGHRGAYYMGAFAHYDGKPVTSHGYRDRGYKAAWTLGWMDAKKGYVSFKDVTAERNAERAQNKVN